MSTVDEIKRDLACPQCEYNLRGLHGAVVMCPECGHACDVAKMVSQRWTRPWHQAPGLSTIYAPTAWLVLLGFFVTPCIFSTGSSQSNLRLIMLALLVGGWVVLMARAWAVFGSEEGIKHGLLSHAIFAAYIAGAVPLVGSTLALLVTVLVPDRDAVAPGWIVVLLVLIPVGVFLINLGRRGERYIAERCIRQYLNRAPKS